jgi:hypothetical protein
VDYTLKLGLRKPSLDDLVDVNELNYNMDVLDSHTHTPEEIGAATADSFTAHLADNMPHMTTDPSTNKVYRWGLAIQNGEWGIIYEEVV